MAGCIASRIDWGWRVLQLVMAGWLARLLLFVCVWNTGGVVVRLWRSKYWILQTD